MREIRYTLCATSHVHDDTVHFFSKCVYINKIISFVDWHASFFATDRLNHVLCSELQFQNEYKILIYRYDE